ncbi:MAG: TIGR00296 family protein [Thaumarchaeota archaeon]|nr:TIGR00296 family protein [Nitrososphaerota archaeon]
MSISDIEGETLVRLARKTVTDYLSRGHVVTPEPVSPVLQEKRGVFVTLNKITGEEALLRGCIGYPLPVKPLVQALVEASLSSALRDPRFPPVSKQELPRILFEVSVLTPPILLKAGKPKEYPSHIRVGTDGLIVEWKQGSGLLLPQVAVEMSWNPEDFLSNTCVKAGAPPDEWLNHGTTIYRFQAEIFEEESPGGQVLRKKI